MDNICKVDGCTSKEFYLWQKMKLCKTHEKDRQKQSYSRNREKVLKRQKKEYGTIAWARQRVGWFKAWDKRQGLASKEDLDAQVFLEIHHSSCAYCGSTERIGMDRIDNEKGHEKNNIIPCCKSCNLTRANRFTVSEFLKLGPVLKEIREQRTLTSTDKRRTNF